MSAAFAVARALRVRVFVPRQEPHTECAGYCKTETRPRSKRYAQLQNASVSGYVRSVRRRRTPPRRADEFDSRLGLTAGMKSKSTGSLPEGRSVGSMVSWFLANGIIEPNHDSDVERPNRNRIRYRTRLGNAGRSMTRAACNAGSNSPRVATPSTFSRVIRCSPVDRSVADSTSSPSRWRTRIHVLR